MRLRWRIALPFAILSAALFGALTGVAADRVVAAVERKLAERSDHLAGLLSRAPSLGDPSILSHIREAFGAEVAVEISVDGRSVMGFSTLPEHLATFTGWMDSGIVRRESGRLQPVPELSGAGGGRYLAAYGSMASDRGMLLLFRPKLVDEEIARSMRPLLGVAFVGLILVGLVAYGVARTIASPVERLAGIAREVSRGTQGVTVESAGGGREITGLADALRSMLEALRLQEEQRVQSERMVAIGQMAAGVAHEIRNPLSTMKLTAQMLREERSGKDRESVEVLLREIERLELATTELFSAAHPAPLDREPTELPRLIDEVLDLLKPQLKHLSVEVRRNFSGGTVLLDRRIFKRAILNLILNGAEAMTGGGTLEVSTGVREGRVRFSVRDSGSGIPRDVRDRVFEPFVTAKPGGVGLGLAVTKRIVEDHGGRIGFETSDQGTTFWIDIAAHG